jgi:hypothetical protein
VWHEILKGKMKFSDLLIKKPLFEKLSEFSCFFLPLSSQKVFLVPSTVGDEKKFSSNMASGLSQNPLFPTDFKNVNLILVKSAPKKGFSQKTDLPIEKSFFWAKLQC